MTTDENEKDDVAKDDDADEAEDEAGDVAKSDAAKDDEAEEDEDDDEDGEADHDADEDDDEDEDDEDDVETAPVKPEPKPAAKPAATPAAKPAATPAEKAATKPSKADAARKGRRAATSTLADSPTAKKKISDALDVGNAKAAKSSKRTKARRAEAVKRGSPTRNIILFVALVGGLAAAFALLGSSGGGDGPVASPKWKVGETVQVEITVVTTDVNNLDCAMSEEINGRYCAYESQNAKSSKPSDPKINDKVLQPYTTVDRIQFMGSGLWIAGPIKEKLDKENWDRPSPRFTAKCKYAVEGRTKTAFVQWKPGEGWHSGNGWYTGHLSDCTIQ